MPDEDRRQTAADPSDAESDPDAGTPERREGEDGDRLRESEMRRMLGMDEQAPSTVGQLMTEMVGAMGEDRHDGTGSDDSRLEDELRRLRDEVHDVRRELVRIADASERVADALEE